MEGICSARASRIPNTCPWADSTIQSSEANEKIISSAIILNPKNFPVKEMVRPWISPERTGKQRITLWANRQLQREETMPAGWGRSSISFWHVHFQSSSMQTALLSGRVGRCGLKTNAKIGSTFSPRQAIFKLSTETDTSDVGRAATFRLGCTAVTRVHTGGWEAPTQGAVLCLPFFARHWLDFCGDPTFGWNTDVSWAEICTSKEDPGWKKEERRALMNNRWAWGRSRWGGGVGE